MKVNYNEQYEKRIILNLRHAYFAMNEVPVSLYTTAATAASLRKNGGLFRRDAPGSWSVCIQSGKGFNFDDEAGVLRFEIRPAASDFYYCSSLPEGASDGWRIVDDNSPGVWKVIEIPIKGTVANTVREINISIGTVEKYIEIILIFKYNSPDIRLRISENKGDIIFNEPENMQLWDIDHAQRVVSTEPVSMRYPRPSGLKLWEIRNGGERLLSDNVPLPACDSPSPLSPKDTITTYFYY